MRELSLTIARDEPVHTEQPAEPDVPIVTIQKQVYLPLVVR
jgi:hypothetical protein